MRRVSELIRLIAVGFRFLSAGTAVSMLVIAQWAVCQDQKQTPVPKVIAAFDDTLPAGAIGRLGSTRFRHGSQFFIGLSFCDDGDTLVSAGEEHMLCFWDTATGRLKKKLSTKPLSIRGFAMSRNGKYIAVAGFWYDDTQNRSQGGVWILDAVSGAQIQAIERSDNSMDRHEMVFSADGKLLIAIGTEGRLYVNDVLSGTEVLREEVPRDNSPSIALSPDGTTIALASGGNTGMFFLWKWETDKQMRELRIAGSRNRRYSGHLAFSPDGKRVAACVDLADFPIQIWNADGGELMHRLALPDEDTYVRGTLLFSPDGKSLLVPGWRRDRSRSVAIHMFDPHNGNYQGQMDVPAGGHLAMSSDGRYLASTTGTGVRVWDWRRREEVMPNNETHAGSIARIETAAGKIVTASDDGTLRIWDSGAHRQLQVLHHDNWVRDIAISPDSQRLASSALDDTVRLWNMRTGDEVYRLPGHGRLGGVRAVGFAADGKSFVSFGDDFYLRRWDASTGKALAEFKVRPNGLPVPEENDDHDPFEFRFRISQARISPGAQYLALASQTHFILFRTDPIHELHQFENLGSHVAGLTFSMDARYLLTSSWGKPVQIPLADGRMRITSEKDNPISLFDTRNRGDDTADGQAIKTIMLPDGGAGQVAFDWQGRRFAVCSRRPSDSVMIFETGSGKELQKIANLPCAASAVAFTHDGKAVVVGLMDGTAVIWPVLDSPS